MRGVVFVADDLGITAGQNRGIARAARTGLVRETSLCVTGGAVADGVRTARELGLGIGLHLSLTLGHSLTGPIRGITDTAGRFRPLRAVLLACALRRVDATGIGREVAAQLTRLRELGVEPTHLNGHQHVHVFPVVREVVFAAAAAHGLRWTRMPSEPAHCGGRWQPTRLLLARLAATAAPTARRHGCQWLPFVGLATEARPDFGRRAERIARGLTAAATEWMVHPREPDPALLELDPEGHRRASAAELATLADPASAARLGVQPLAFADCAAPAANAPLSGS